MNDQVVEKLRKLLALADAANGGTDAEREVALMKAQQLAFQHNLDLQAVGELTGGTDRRFMSESETLRPADYWQSQLLTVLGRYHFVRVYVQPSGRSGRRTRQVFLVGRSENIEMVRALHRHLVAQLTADLAASAAGYDRYASLAHLAVAGYRKLCAAELGAEISMDGAAAFLRDLPEQQRDRLLERIGGWAPGVRAKVAQRIVSGRIADEHISDLRVFRRVFLLAAVTRIDERLEAVHRRLVDDAGDAGRDLVVCEWDAVDRFLESTGVKLRRQSTKVAWSDAAERAGQAAADAADLGARKLSAIRPALRSGA